MSRLRLLLSQPQNEASFQLDVDGQYEISRLGTGQYKVQSIETSSQHDKRSDAVCALSVRSTRVLLKSHEPIHVGDAVPHDTSNGEASFEDLFVEGSVLLQRGDRFYFDDGKSVFHVEQETEEVQVSSSAPNGNDETTEADKMASKVVSGPDNISGSVDELIQNSNTAVLGATPLASATRIDMIAETPAAVDGRHVDHVGSSQGSDVNGANRIPVRKRIIHVIHDEDETADEDSAYEEENNTNAVTREEKPVRSPDTALKEPFPSPNTFSTPISNSNRTAISEKAEDTEVEQPRADERNVEETVPHGSGRKRSVSPEEAIENAQAVKKQKRSHTPNDSIIEPGTAKKRGRGRPKKNVGSPAVSDTAKAARQSNDVPASSPQVIIGASQELEKRIIFSGSSIVPDNPALKKFLAKQRCKTISDPMETDFDYCCVGQSLSKTAKLLITVARGKQLVTDDWVIESEKAGKLLDPRKYLPSDRHHDWKIKIADIVGKPRSIMFKGLTVYISPTLRTEYGSGFKEIETILTDSGADRVVSVPHRSLGDPNETKYVVLVSEKKDKDAGPLQDAGHILHHRDLIPSSILRGQLDLRSPEFRVSPADTQKKSAKKGRKS